MSQKGFCEFGPFSADLDERILFRDGRMVDIGARTFDVLAVLLEKLGDIVSKETLLDKVWVQKGINVHESNVPYQINALRMALGDTGNPPRYVENLRGRGYRFIAEVKCLAAGARSDRPGRGWNTANEPPSANPNGPSEPPPSRAGELPFKSGASQPPVRKTSTHLDSVHRLRQYRVVLLISAMVIACVAIADIVWFQGMGAALPRLWPRDAALLAIAAALLYAYRKFFRLGINLQAAAPESSAFRGLVPFDRTDADRFFGRDIDTAALFDTVTHNDFRFGTLYGDSGAGKSSLIRAGLMPRLTDAGFAAVYCRAFRDPIRTLVQQCQLETGRGPARDEETLDYLGGVAENSRRGLVLIFDQFEEFFANHPAKEARLPFISLIAACFHEPGLRVRILFGIRSDALPKIASAFDMVIPETLATARRYHLQLFDEAQAAHVIEESMRRANWKFEAGLSKRVARDLAVNGDVLPSELQIVGEQLQNKRIFAVNGYERAGGKEQLVHSHLEDTIALTGDKDFAHLVLRSLVSEENTRLTLTLAEIARRVQRRQDAVKKVLDFLAEQRLVRAIHDEEPFRYELMHEYSIDGINRIAGRVMNAKQKANRRLRDYRAMYLRDRRARIPASKLWHINRYADKPADREARELISKSVRGALVRVGVAIVSFAGFVVLAVAAISRGEEWDDARLADGQKGAVLRIAFSPNGESLASCGTDGSLIIWDFARREEQARLIAGMNRLSALAYSPDGKWIVAAGNDQAVVVCNTQTREKARVLREHKSAIGSMAFSPDGRLLASSSGGIDDRTVIWDARNFEKIAELPSGVSLGHCPILFLDKQRLMVVSSENTPEVWDVTARPRVVNRLVEMSGLLTLAVSPDYQMMTGVTTDGDVVFYDVAHGKMLERRNAHRFYGRAVAYSPDGSLVATGANDIVLWDARTRVILGRFTHTDNVWSLAFSNDNRRLVSAHGDGSILIWDVMDRMLDSSLNGHSAPVNCVAFSQDGRALLSASKDQSILLWDVETGKKQATLIEPKAGVDRAIFLSDSNDIASYNSLGDFKIWDVGNRRARTDLNLAPPDSVFAISPDGRFLVSVVGTYSTSDGQQVLDFAKIGEGQVAAAAFSGDGRWLTAVTTEGGIYFWDAETWKLVDNIESHITPLIRVCVSHDGRHLATGGANGAVDLFETSPLRRVASLNNHTSAVNSVAFSFDGKRLVSAGGDSAICLWDVQTQHLIARIGSHIGPVKSVAFSPDGLRIASGENDKSVHIYTRHRTILGHRMD